MEPRMGTRKGVKRSPATPSASAKPVPSAAKTPRGPAALPRRTAAQSTLDSVPRPQRVQDIRATVTVGDLTALTVDALVIPAFPKAAARGGVSAAIVQKAG